MSTIGQEIAERDGAHARQEADAATRWGAHEAAGHADAERKRSVADQEAKLNGMALYTLLAVIGLALIGVLTWYFSKPAIVAQAPVLNRMPVRTTTLSAAPPAPQLVTTPGTPTTPSASPAPAAPIVVVAPLAVNAPTPAPAVKSAPVTTTPPASSPSAPTTVSPSTSPSTTETPAQTSAPVTSTPATNAADTTSSSGPNTGANPQPTNTTTAPASPSSTTP